MTRPFHGDDLLVEFDCGHSDWFTPTEVRWGNPTCTRCSNRPTKENKP